MADAVIIFAVGLTFMLIATIFLANFVNTIIEWLLDLIHPVQIIDKFLDWIWPD